MLIDRFMPEFDVSSTSHTVIQAAPDDVFAAVRALDLSRSSVVRALGWIRLLPERLRRWRKRETPPAAPTALTFDDLAKSGGWVILGEDPGSELALGLIGQFWRRDLGIVRVEPGEFASFDRPGYAKTIVDISIRPYGHGRSLVTCENRTVATDETARGRFRRYWTFIRPAAAIIGWRMLALIRSAAERPHGSEPAIGGSGS